MHITKKLSLKEAQELSKKMLLITEETEKRQIRDEILFGTIYVLYKQLNNSYLPYFPMVDCLRVIVIVLFLNIFTKK